MDEVPSVKSFMQIAPCGTTALIFSNSDVFSFRKTLWNLFDRKFLISSNKSPEIPKDLILNIKPGNLTKQHFNIPICFWFQIMSEQSSPYRDHQQIPFVMLNIFSPLSKHPSNIPLLLMENTKLDGIPSKITWKLHVLSCIVFQAFKVLLIKEYNIQLVYQFLYFLLFYIASQFTSADIIFTTF